MCLVGQPCRQGSWSNPKQKQEKNWWEPMADKFTWTAFNFWTWPWGCHKQPTDVCDAQGDLPFPLPEGLQGTMCSVARQGNNDRPKPMHRHGQRKLQPFWDSLLNRKRTTPPGRTRPPYTTKTKKLTARLNPLEMLRSLCRLAPTKTIRRTS